MRHAPSCRLDHSAVLTWRRCGLRQGVVASLEEPTDEMANEMREQMEPSSDAMAQLQTAVSGKRAMLAEVESEVLAQKAKVEEQLKKNQSAKLERKEQHDGVRTAIEDLKQQVGTCHLASPLASPLPSDGLERWSQWSAHAEIDRE